jgi:uncharacterized protein (TIGR03083 family)
MKRNDDLDTAVERWGLSPLVAALAEGDASTPPDDVRRRLLGHAAAAPPQLSRTLTPVDLYRARVVALETMLETLADQDWARRANPYQWSVHGLIAHLLVIEQCTAALFGLATMPAGDENDHLAVGRSLIESELLGSPLSTADRWRETARQISDHIGSDSFQPNAPAGLHGWPFTGSSLLVARAFELWTHVNDIERAVGRLERTTPAEELRTMSSFSVATLPYTLSLVDPVQTLSSARVVLTGPGGGTFDIGTGERTTLIVADVVEYCRMVARRIDPDALDSTIEGDIELAGALLRASQAFAV